MITVKTTVNATIEKVWDCFTQASHIVNWYFASPDWHAPLAENDLKVGGKFKTNMTAKDGSFAFDFEGIYSNVEKHRYIAYGLGDGRKVEIRFEENNHQTEVTESFDPETLNPEEMQKAGWQAILDNFKKYTESI